jgi:tetraacyldisaccharide 4'-kinase
VTKLGINKLWYRPSWRWAAWLLAPLAGLFALLSGLRRVAYRAGLLRSRHPGVPVIVVGNLTVGGSGKTPFVIWLAQQLSQRGRKVGIVSRGYGGTQRLAARLPDQADPSLYGDEPALIQAATGLPVAVAAVRSQAAERLVEGDAVDLIVCDDGLQHYALRRDFEIAVVDGQRGFGNRWLLPAGPLREPRSRLRSVDAVVVRDPGVAGLPGLRELTSDCVDMRLVLGGLRSLLTDKIELTDVAQWRGRTVHAVAGIGMPERFFAALRAAGLAVLEREAPDHHRWSARELNFGDGLPVLMTGKDGVKCRGFAQPHWYSVELRAEIPPAQAERLLTRLLARIGARVTCAKLP